MARKSLQIVIASPRWTGTIMRCMALAGGLAARMSPLGMTARIRYLSGFSRWRLRSGVFSPLRSPFVLVSVGSIGERRAREIRQRARPLVWLHIDELKSEADGPDLVFVSPMEWQEAFSTRPHYIRLESALHRVSRQTLDRARQNARRRLQLSDDEHAVAFLIGGPSAAFHYDGVAHSNLANAIIRARGAGSAVLATTSRRTLAETQSAVAAVMPGGRCLYAGKGPNPYPDFLAAADEFVVTEDSVSMCCEAVATGKPVSMLRLSPVEGERLQKFRQFQHRMQSQGVLPIYGEQAALPAPAAILNDCDRAAGLAWAEVSRRLGRQADVVGAADLLQAVEAR